MSQDRLYTDKELSWLSFNERVLQEAADKSNPLIERMRFLGIYSNNLDEFYKVRFADVKRRILINEERGSATSARNVLKKIQAKVAKTDQEFDVLYNELLLEIARNQIFLINERQISPNQQIWLRQYFRQHLRPHITPILINPETNLVEFLKDDYTYLAVEIVHSQNIQYALLEIPSDKVPRFVNLPPEMPHRRKSMILLDNIMRYCLDEIFKGFFDYDSLNAYSMKMTRDSEYDLATEMESSLLELMSSTLKQRLTAEPVRFVYQREMPDEMVELLRSKLGLSNNDSVIAGGRYHNFKDFIKFPNEGKRNLLNKPLPRLRHTWFDNFRNGFDAIREQDVLLYYPYHTFEHVLELLRQASFDPSVLSIKINIYRVAKDSRIIDSMIHAAHNGKKVTVVVELQARFDEEANIHWAKRLTEAGVHVIFSAPGLKIHAKLFVISRLEGEEIVRYAHIGTGNFNEKTARLYTDYSLLTANPKITNEVRRVFNFIENPYRPVKFENLMVSPQNSRAMLNQLISQEIANASANKPAGIMLKINNLVDKELVDRLYDASEAGVKIRLLIRGMCSLVPSQPGFSENIQITSIVDRFLEHDRVYVFTNDGDEKVFLSSADWMTRNIDYRIEVAVCLLDPQLKQRVLDILELQFNDTVKARYVDKELSNSYVLRGNKRKIRAQLAIYDYLKALEQPEPRA
ncbi:polyphosphate kinase 1 [Photorhabdus laumondii subsp. laumondii]|uniref:Polyphosphate kinase n=2 Tax=Photorhabdus laumondii subsp. laumondii TaxID=141679 RepID=Q7N3F4_PHOLL|nr:MULTISPECIES: polyphosphate kinase 1 [Photorhabdus]AWK42485.1 RNA degradosome polyphosphate kinase [Photorhabdus laumondii subsp. laumondii]AXG43335.1 polyphosphate kinase 1 [Photorhabdus laumondii subsp. laumondii]AXG47807.1 polyphosphate kinase 1 [Photorhabdus laumondii subsp. laumondii]KTL63510.1 polyphosphate kinase [Photorhabdus laumondii subsp. laumondii]MCC8384257.1 polyphosphate kinase 1 [Photorhabdus laumondii]